MGVAVGVAIPKVLQFIVRTIKSPGEYQPTKWDEIRVAQGVQAMHDVRAICHLLSKKRLNKHDKQVLLDMAHGHHASWSPNGDLQTEQEYLESKDEIPF